MSLRQAVGLFSSLALAAQALAAVSLSDTRLVFDGRFSDMSIEARNRGSEEVLLQAWLEAGDEATRAAHLPFVLTPPLARLAPDGRQALRLLYEGRGMPMGRESLVHLYVMEIPRSAAGEGQLSIAIRQRLNVLFRPPGLPGDPALVPAALRWMLEQEGEGGPQLRVHNPTPFHAALLNLELTHEQERQQLADHLLLAPGEQRTLALVPRLRAGHLPQLRFNALTDYGGQRRYSGQFAANGPFSASLLGDASSLQNGLLP